MPVVCKEALLMLSQLVHGLTPDFQMVKIHKSH